MEPFIIIALLVLLVTAIFGVLILAYLYFSLHSQASRQITAILGAQNEAAQQRAAAQIQEWRESEIDAVRKEQGELAHQQALGETTCLEHMSFGVHAHVGWGI